MYREVKLNEVNEIEVTSEFPQPFECSIYRSLNSDLADLGDDELINHYKNCGEIEGRISNRLQTREEFAGLAVSLSSILEIGPFASPLIKSDHTKYADILNTEQLKVKANSLGISESLVPDIDYVIDAQSMKIEDQFDCVLSSHVIEHSLDFISHLNQVEEMLKANGCYFLLVPDHRYCFDHFQTPSGISDVIEAHLEKRKQKSFKCIFNGSFCVTHNTPSRHWIGDHGTTTGSPDNEVAKLISRFQENSENEFDDVHCWYFTPRSFAQICTQLVEMNFISLKLERLYPTRRNSNEFWAILRKPSMR